MNTTQIRISSELKEEIDILRATYVKKLFEEAKDRKLIRKIANNGLSYSEFLRIVLSKFTL